MYLGIPGVSILDDPGLYQFTVFYVYRVRNTYEKLILRVYRISFPLLWMSLCHFILVSVLFFLIFLYVFNDRVILSLDRCGFSWGETFC